jgi:hypothetical protein
MSKPASGTDQWQEHFEGQEYASQGGWLAPVWNLTRWLRANSCFDYAYRLEQEAQSIPCDPLPSVEAECQALDAIFRLLPRLYNQPPKNLTQEQYKELTRLRREATRFVQYRRRQLIANHEQRAEAVRDVGNLLKKFRREAADRSAQSPPPVVTGPLVPTRYLMSWREIIDALGLKNNEESRRQVRQLNQHYQGPIVLPTSRGKQPKVNKDKLLSWWNGLEQRFCESEKKQADAHATVQAQHGFGRNGTVVPEIAGHVRNRRGHKNAR